MLDIRVGEYLHVAPERGSVAESLMRSSLYQSLIGEAGACMDVHANEARPDGGRDGQRASSVVSQDVDTERKIEAAPDFATQRCHERHGVRLHPPRIERNIAEVFHDQSIDTACRQFLS